MSDLLKDQPTLEQSEESGAIIGVVPGEADTDETHKMNISELVDAQGRENPLNIDTASIELISFSGEDTNNRASASNALAVKEGTELHSFADGYDSILILVYSRIRNTINNNFDAFIPKHVPIAVWDNSDASDPIEIELQTNQQTQRWMSVWRISDTSFGFNGTQSPTRYLASIYGISNSVSITIP